MTTIQMKKNMKNNERRPSLSLSFLFVDTVAMANLIVFILIISFLVSNCESFLWYPLHHHHPTSQLKQQTHHRTRDRNNSNSNNNNKSRLFSLNDHTKHEPIRLNKVLKATHSRRQADKIIAEGRVSVNGETSYGCMVQPFVDNVCLDGKPIQGWEDWNAIPITVSTDNDENNDSKRQRTETATQSTTQSRSNTFSYIKYWKPRGVICTTDRSVSGNILDQLEQHDGCHVRRDFSRLYPVGRLDKDTTGLLLLTNDGRLPNAALRKEHKQTKVYNVRARWMLDDHDLDCLSQGVVITTVAQRDGKKAAPLTAPTLPCRVDRLDGRSCRIYLTEGRNRQIRRMLQAIDNEVVDLHRVSFGGGGKHKGGVISLRGLDGPGDWQELEGEEMGLIDEILERAS